MSRRIRMNFYLVLAIAGLVGGLVLFYQLLLDVGASSTLMVESEVRRTLLGNPVATGISMDALFCGAAFLVWLIHEARTLVMSRWWIYVLLLFSTPLAFAFPIFLFFREKRLEQLGWE